MMIPALYIVATPIGNLDDMSRRAVSVLQQVDCIAAEDTRHSTRLLQHYDIRTRLQAYHEFGGDGQLDSLFRYLEQGRSVALISDAGTPLISDPGYRLVRRVQDAGIAVVPVPGPSAVIAALCASGQATDRFCFEGFLPARANARRESLQALANEPRSMVFYEAPHRIVACLADMADIFGGERQITLARELTKTFETIVRKPLADMSQWVAADGNQQRGEIVLVVEGRSAGRNDGMNDEARRLVTLLIDDLPPQMLSKRVAEYCRLPKKQVYDYILSLKK